MTVKIESATHKNTECRSHVAAINSSSIDNLPSALFSSQQVRDIDYSAIHKHGINGFELMKKAAQFSFDVLIAKYQNVATVIVLCGSGNNAGDGYIVAGLAKQRGLAVKVYYLSEPEKLSGDAALAYQFASEENIQIQHFAAESLRGLEATNTIIVDALLGTGLNSEVRGIYQEAIQAANGCQCDILAIDIPSGLSADSGHILGHAIIADTTTTFIGMKFGLLTGQARSCAGEIFYHDLEVNQAIINEQVPLANTINTVNLQAIHPRKAHSHKGDFGHSLIIGGNKGYGGAAILSSAAALSSGSGLTSVIMHDSNISASLARHPEIMACGHSNLKQSLNLIDAATNIVIGPGIGQDAWAQRMLQEVINIEKPVVLDADALNLVSTNECWKKSIKALRELRTLTPHPGEAARLLKSSASAIQENRLAALHELYENFACNILLKGSGSLTIDINKHISLCPYGNPGMATGGMGDVLSGVIAALQAQNHTADIALNTAVLLHAKAADIIALKQGEIGLKASELIPVIRQLLNEVIH